MKLTEYLTNSLFREGIISEEDKEVVQYGLEGLLGNLLGIILIMAIGIGFGHILEAIFLWVFWFFLRKNAGGFHAKTKVGCLMISIGILMVSFILFAAYEHTMIFYLLCGMSTGSIIWLMAPVDNSAKRLDLVEYKVYQRRSRIILILEEVLLLVALRCGIDEIMKSIVMALFVVSISLVLGELKSLWNEKMKEK